MSVWPSQFRARQHSPSCGSSVCAIALVPSHALRHTSANFAIDAGVHQRTAADRVGRSTPSLVMITYGHVTGRMHSEVTASLST